MTAPFLERLAQRTSEVGSVLCLGLDPTPDALPAGFAPSLAGVERFARLLVDAAAPHAAAVKPNLAFFEAYGAAGIAALERVRAAIPSDIPVIADAKRGDIGSTARRQAIALFDALGADAVTVNPYLGEEALAPFLERVDRFAYVLCRTSNPGAGEIQALPLRSGEPVWARVARLAAGWGPGGTVGLVVGARVPDDLAAARRVAPGLAFLVPGVGAQGGEPGAALRDGPATAPPAGARVGRGLLVNVSRGIAGAALSDAADDGSDDAFGDPGERIARAARAWSERLAVLR